MNGPTKMTSGVVLLSLAGLMFETAAAQDPRDDPPGRAARLSWIGGSASFQPGGVEDWVPAALNRPLTTGDRLWTEAGARVEVQLGSAAFRLGGRTNFTFLNLNDDTAQVQLSSGTLSVRVRNLADRETIEIDTPQAAFSLLRPGEYRMEVNDRGEITMVTVWAGHAEAATEDQVFSIWSREQVRVSEENGQPVFDRRGAPVVDAFDRWCQERDRREDRSESARHVSRDLPGYADLDDHGVWREDLQYAWIWFPRVHVGWVPYHYGHWAWIEPWGWTWVDDAPWGYAPFHYGRWAFVAGAWGWIPGPAVVRPMYSPALVAWVGGPHFSIGVSIGGPPIGWFPLAPHEVWVPPYRHSKHYVEQVNVSNTVIVNRTVINNINVNTARYVNREVTGAVTVVPRDVLVGGRPVGSAAVGVAAGAAVRGQIETHAGVVPERAAILGGRAPTGSAPPREVQGRVIVTRAAPPSPPVSFSRRQAALQERPGLPLDRATENQMRQAEPTSPSGVRQARPPSPPRIGGQSPPRSQVEPGRPRTRERGPTAKPDGVRGGARQEQPQVQLPPQQRPAGPQSQPQVVRPRPTENSQATVPSRTPQQPGVRSPRAPQPARPEARPMPNDRPDGPKGSRPDRGGQLENTSKRVPNT